MAECQRILRLAIVADAEMNRNLGAYRRLRLPRVSLRAMKRREAVVERLTSCTSLPIVGEP